jgi:uncharacterized protein
MVTATNGDSLHTGGESRTGKLSFYNSAVSIGGHSMLKEKQSFDHSIVEHAAHRPYPMPDRPWIMRQSCQDLLFAHWPITATVMRSLVPRELPLDTFEGQAWLGIVPFYMSNVTMRGVPPLPWISEFPELNVRTYVTLDDKPGVYFFSLDAANPVAVGVARLLAGLPYYTADMNVDTDENVIRYSSRRRTAAAPAELVGSYHASGHPVYPSRGSLEYWLTERYCVYTVNDGDVYRLDIHHLPWPLQPAEATFTVNTMTRPIALELPDARPFTHFARRQDMVAWAPVKR